MARGVEGGKGRWLICNRETPGAFATADRYPFSPDVATLRLIWLENKARLMRSPSCIGRASCMHAPPPQA